MQGRSLGRPLPEKEGRNSMKPLKAKVFTCFTMDISPPSEIQINEWLSSNPGIEIVDTVQSESMAVKDGRFERNLTITFLYHEA